MNWAMEKSLLAAYTPPLRNKVREPAGSPTPFGWAYPVLDCAGVECGRRASANWGRGLRAPSPCPYPQGGTLQALRASSPQGEPLNLFSLHSEGGEIRKISHAEHRSSLKSWFGAEIGGGLASPPPCPLPMGQPFSPARRRTASLTQGSQGALRREEERERSFFGKIEKRC